MIGIVGENGAEEITGIGPDGIPVPLVPTITHAHAVTITPIAMTTGSLPYAFTARCCCGWSQPRNAYKWVTLGVQSHYIAEGLTNGKGLLQPEGFGAEMGA
jgi:hypothetical protein